MSNKYHIYPSKFFRKKYQISQNFYYIIERVIAFTSDRKRMTTVIHTSENKGNYTIFTKGAPEVMKNILNKESLINDYD